MKKIVLICFLMFFVCTPVPARDFIVKFVEENYKEAQVQFSYDPLIYHSIQVNSDVGPKILILTGSDYNYRKWLRSYISQNKEFITKVPEEEINNFIAAKAYKIDVTSLHPFNYSKWKDSESKEETKAEIKENNTIMIVDPDEDRTRLISTVAGKMGYPVSIFKDGNEALDVFKTYPEKFGLIIAHHAIEGMDMEQFVTKAVKINHDIPIAVDTGYADEEMKNRFLSKFSGAGSIHVKPVILRDLQKTLDSLLNKNA